MTTLKKTAHLLIDASVYSLERRDNIKDLVNAYDGIIETIAKELNSIAVSDDAMMRTRVLAAANILSTVDTVDINQLINSLKQYKNQIEFFRRKL